MCNSTSTTFWAEVTALTWPLSHRHVFNFSDKNKGGMTCEKFRGALINTVVAKSLMTSPCLISNGNSDSPFRVEDSDKLQIE